MSLLCEIPIKHNYGITGEIDLQGNVLPIGGLDSKSSGAKEAGIIHVLFPSKNNEDYRKIVSDGLIDNNFAITMISG